MSVKDKYNRISRYYDFLKRGDMRRWSKAQTDFFSRLKGKVLYVGAGPGPEIVNFPPGLDIIAIDLSYDMLKAASERAARYPGKFKRVNMNVESLGFPDRSFDNVLAVCVFCTVENPVRGLKELRRILKPGGKIFMFEHVLSKNPLYGLILKLMSIATVKLSGTHLDRETAENVKKAGFTIESDRNIYLDIVKTIIARNDPSGNRASAVAERSRR